ncbi:MAG: ATP-binding protein [Anaerolineales bacterium]|nr:ATP-binding protein [Anaerolineales bacterium]
MSDELKGILKKIGENTSKVNSPTSSNTNQPDGHLRPEMVGDPNCPHCGGLGYVRADKPLGHPEFGRTVICICRKDEVAQQARRRLYAISRLDELNELTFENFEPRGRVGLPARQADSLEQAFNQAQQFAQRMDGWLLLEGGYGSGKTHLAAAIANFAVQVGLPTIFITVPDLLDSLRFTYGSTEESFEERFEEIRQAPLLILDDFGTQNATAWAQEKLFQIINHRYINRLPLIVTTNLALDQIEGRIRSRLSDPELVTQIRMLAPDYRRPTDDSANELSSLHLLRERNFASFDLREDEGLPAADSRSLKKAFDAARKFAEKPKGWLLLTGGHGSGKTHLAAAIANYAQDIGRMPLFIMVPDLLDHLRATFNPTSPVSYDQRFEEIRNAELLVLDDLGTQSATPWAREKLYQLFTHRYNAQLPTVITTADRLEDMDTRIRARMLDTRLCTIYAITAPAYTGRKKR